MSASRGKLNFQFAALPTSILEHHDAGALRDVDLVVISKLIGRFRGWLIHETDEALAQLCGVAESTFKETLRRLRGLGLVRSLKATVRGFRRALSLVWLAPPEEAQQPLLPAESEAVAAASQGPSLRPLEAIPPDPPIEVVPEVKTDDNDYAKAAASAEACTSSSFDDEQPQRKATKAEVEAVVAKAKALFPSAWMLPQQIRTQAKRCAAAGGGLQWVAMALREAELSNARAFGFVTSILERWRNQGYPTPRIPNPAAPSRSFAAALAEKQRAEHLAQMAEASKPEPAPSESEIQTLRDLVAKGPHVFGYRFALKRLQEAGIPIPATNP